MISIAIHLVLAGLFLVYSLNGSALVEPGRRSPVSSFEQVTEELKLEPVVNDLQLEPLVNEPVTSKPEHAVGPISPVMGDSPGAPVIAALASGDGGALNLAGPVVGASAAAQSSFFGTSGKAATLCFVVDCSGSMVMAFDYVKEELRRSIRRLTPGHYFYVVFFAGGEPIELHFGQLIRATSGNRREALRFIDEAELVSVSTEAAAWEGVAAGLRRAFELRSADGRGVDLIYLLTDGEFDHAKVSGILAELQRQRAYAAVINVVACGSRDSEQFLQSLAGGYQGRYRFVSDEELSRLGQEQ